MKADAFVYLAPARACGDGRVDAESDPGGRELRRLGRHGRGTSTGSGYADVIVGPANRHTTSGQADEGRALRLPRSAGGPAATTAWTAESDQAEPSSAFRLPRGAGTSSNGERVRDVIVRRLPPTTNGQLTEGRAYVYLARVPASPRAPAWTAESNWDGV